MMDFEMLEEKLNEKHFVVTDFFTLSTPVHKLNTTWNFIVSPTNILDMAIAKRYFMHINNFDILNLKRVYYNPSVINQKQYIIRSYIDGILPSKVEVMFYRPLFTLHVLDVHDAKNKHLIEKISFDVLCNKNKGKILYNKNNTLNDLRQFTYIMEMLLKHDVYITDELYNTVKDLFNSYSTFRRLRLVHFEDVPYHTREPNIPYLTVHGFDTRVPLP